jgi:3',5'-cyclic AMP phosphodiesterase CpdA
MAASRMPNRRELLRLGAGGLLAMGLWPGHRNARAGGKEEFFHFLVVNDTHYRDDRCGPWLEKAIRQMRAHKEKIDFCLLAGDLSEDGKAEQLLAMKVLIGSLDLPTYVVIGNHDYFKQDVRSAYDELFPKRLNYQFEHRGWQFVGLDTTQGQLARNTTIQKPTLTWLADNLPKLDKRKPTVVFTHFPLGPFVIGRPKNAADVLNAFKEYDLQAVFSGHWHGLTERKTGKTVLTTNRCCSLHKPNHDSTPQKGYFLCCAREGRVEHTFVEVKTP